MNTTLFASIGINIGKEVFHVVGFGTDRKIAFRTSLREERSAALVALTPNVALERGACLGSGSAYC